jgi:GNAT superfamily N-acetyltransferase
MFKLTEFTEGHIEQATRIAMANYEEERASVPVLPPVSVFPDLSRFADNRLGVAAFEDGQMVGFLCCYNPREHHFGLTRGTFSPIHAHGTVKTNRRMIYSRLYQAAAELWVQKGILSHAIALYAHNAEAVQSFFWNGFGLRCIDAIRPVEKLTCERKTSSRAARNLCVSTVEILTCERETGYESFELPSAEASKLLPLKNLLITHLAQSPMFLPNSQFTEAEMVETARRRNSRFFCAKRKDDTDGIIAYIELMESGENFACDDPLMVNICGACMLPQYRGSGLYTELLAFLLQTLKAEGYTRLGVDFESFNPTARGFWLRYFTPYTYSVARRIDERICPNLAQS